MQCWKCREPVQGAVCPGCGAIQPPRPQPDPYELLGLERRFSLEAAELQAAWKRLSRQVHPDRFVQRSAVERRMSLQWTAAINEARRVLKDASRRAWYLSTGHPRPPETGGPAPDGSFLEDMFRLRMEIEEGETEALEEAKTLRASAWEQVEQLFARWEAGEDTLSEIPERLARLKYLDSLLAAS